LRVDKPRGEPVIDVGRRQSIHGVTHPSTLVALSTCRRDQLGAQEF
jgi:hypothetical protein